MDCHIRLIYFTQLTVGDMGVNDLLFRVRDLQQRPAILGAMSILGIGFAIFALSSFPPTRLFGGLVASGLVLSAMLALKVLPSVAGGRPSENSQET